MDDKNETLLHLATKRQSINCVQEILQLNPNEIVKLILSKDKHLVTPLHLAAQHESAKILKVRHKIYNFIK